MNSAMESGGTDEPENGLVYHFRGSRRRHAAADGPVAPPAAVCAGAVVSGQNFVTLPAWFPVAKVAAVLRLKNQPFALISDETGASGVANAEEVARAAPDKSLLSCTTPLGSGIAHVTPIDHALRIMDAQRVDHLLVVLGGAVVGVLSRPAALQAIASAAEAAAPGQARVGTGLGRLAA